MQRLAQATPRTTGKRAMTASVARRCTGPRRTLRAFLVRASLCPTRGELLLFPPLPPGYDRDASRQATNAVIQRKKRAARLRHGYPLIAVAPATRKASFPLSPCAGRDGEGEGGINGRNSARHSLHSPIAWNGWASRRSFAATASLGQLYGQQVGLAGYLVPKTFLCQR